MSLDLSDTLIIGISVITLFDIREAASMFQKNSESNQDHTVETYRDDIRQLKGSVLILVYPLAK